MELVVTLIQQSSVTKNQVLSFRRHLYSETDSDLCLVFGCTVTGMMITLDLPLHVKSICLVP